MPQASQRFDFRVRQSGATMKASRDDSLVANDHRADSGVRTRLSEPTTRFTQGRTHEFFVVHAPGLFLALRRWNPDFRGVSLSFRDKQRLYQRLSQLVRSGIPFPSAVDKLTSTSHGATRHLLRKLRHRVSQGKTVGEAFACEHPAVTVLETAVLTAVERSGRLEHGLQELANYFGGLAQARATIIKRCAYPFFLLHFGIFALAVPTLIFRGIQPFVMQTFGVLLGVYAVAAVIAFLMPMLGNIAATSVSVDRLLRTVPLIGRIRRSFALSRFCTVYEIQLDAGVNIIDSLLTAGQASRSGLVHSACNFAVPELRSGAQVGPLLAASGAFPAEVIQSFMVGEETGGLDKELKRLADELRIEALGTLETLSEWVPRLIYLAIVLYFAYQIILFYMGYFRMITELAS
jgi:type IV pilus assembly protein PilC